MKLFKNIRQNTINDGKLKNYLFYAIGEILLVMIGISLAFQADNWNENRIKNNTERRYYENIRDQISDDKDLILSQRAFNIDFQKQFNYLNDIIESNDRTKVDSISYIVRNLTQYSDFDRQGNIYETLVNSGEIKLLRNHKIINGIRELEERYIYINRMENIHYDAIMTHVIVSINPMISFSNMKVKKANELYSYEFQNLILSLLQIMTEKDKVYNEALLEIQNVNKLIELELEIN